MISSGERIRAGYRQSLSGTTRSSKVICTSSAWKKLAGLNKKKKRNILFPEACNDQKLDRSHNKKVSLSITSDKSLIRMFLRLAFLLYCFFFPSDLMSNTSWIFRLL